MKEIIIGVYRSLNPINAIGKKRLEAVLDEAKNQNIKLVFFDDKDIVISQNMISGKYRENKNWKNVKTHIPEVIINPLPTSIEERTTKENYLRNISVFTSYAVMEKYSVYKKLMEHEEYKKYAIESIKVKDYTDIIEVIEKYKRVVLKPINGRQGQGIYFIYKDKNKFIVLEDKKRVTFNKEQFKMFIDQVVIEGDHIIQPYIEAKTKNGEPYDFRIHIHRDGKGEWDIVKSYPRIGSSKGILSNISKGGRTLEIDKFLEDEFGENWVKIKEDIEKLAINLGDYINEFSENNINEIGVDIAIDGDGNYYTYELNGGPESKYHEKERAKYVIEYAKYLYNKHINDLTEDYLKYIGTEFLKIENKLLKKDFSDEKYIGVLAYPGDDERLNKAFGFRGLEEEVNVFHFYESDIDYRNKAINGKYYDRIMLKEKRYPYPDVIIDRLRMRGFDDFQKIYDEFEDIPFNIDRDGASVDKSYAYELIKDKELQKHIIPYKKSPSKKDIFEFLNEYKSIVLKPDQGTKGDGVILITNRVDYYEFIQDNEKEKLDEDSIKDRIEEILSYDSYILQRYIKSRYKDNRPYDVRVHMVKSDSGNWQLVKSYAKVGSKNKLTSNSTGGGYIGELDPVLDYKFGEEKDNIFEKLIGISHKLNIEVEKNIDGKISEIGYDIAITSDGEIYIYEINLNKPNPLFYEYELAKHLIKYAIYLMNNNKDL